MFRVWNRQKRRESANELRRTLRLLRVRSVVAADGRREKKISCGVRGAMCAWAIDFGGGGGGDGSGRPIVVLLYNVRRRNKRGKRGMFKPSLTPASSLPSHRSRRSCRSPNPTQITPKLLSPPSYSQLSNKCLHSAAASRLPSSPPCLGPPPLVRHRARGGSLNRQLGLLLLAAVVHYTRHESSGRAV